jgi:hypothetical protein
VTGRLRSRRTDALRRRRRLRCPAEPSRRRRPRQCRRLNRGAVLRRRGGRPPQQREAVGEIAADDTFTDFTDSARYVSLWRLRHAKRSRKPAQDPCLADISLGLLGSSALRSTGVGTESRCDGGNVSWRAPVLNVPA